ncbi:hypothetical protein D3C79_891190 [compost metagenome]
MLRQAVVEKHIEDNAGKAPSLCGETCQRCQYHGMAVGITVDVPVQADRRFQCRRKAPFQRALDEIAIQAAEQLLRRRAAQVQVCEVVHGASLAPPRPISSSHDIAIGAQLRTTSYLYIAKYRFKFRPTAIYRFTTSPTPCPSIWTK